MLAAHNPRARLCSSEMDGRMGKMLRENIGDKQINRPSRKAAATTAISPTDV